MILRREILQTLPLILHQNPSDYLCNSYCYKYKGFVESLIRPIGLVWYDYKNTNEELQ